MRYIDVCAIMAPGFSLITLSLCQMCGLALLNIEINRQAAMIGYLSDFKLMMWLTLLALPLLVPLRRPPRVTRGANQAVDAPH